MIRFVVTPGHEYTFDALRDRKKKVRELPIELWTYRHLAAAKALPQGTWVFTDLERLAVWELRLAGEAARLLKAAGARVLNDPARGACRYELLLRLHQAGFNRFRAWRAEDGAPSAARFPVFLRLESNHGMPVSGLVETPEALAAELDRLATLGVSRRGVLIVEYEAEALAPGVFRKYGAYRFGDRIVADHMVHDVTWLAKYGDYAVWTDERYAEEAAYVRDNPHREALMQAFEIAGLDYGRADYGLVGGRVQLWEINSNPYLPAGDVTKAPPQRREATLASRAARLDGIAALDSPAAGPPVAMDSDLLKAHRARQNWRRRDMIRD
jgi:hypothetical protein